MTRLYVVMYDMNYPTCKKVSSTLKEFLCDQRQTRLGSTNLHFVIEVKVYILLRVIVIFGIRMLESGLTPLSL